MLQNYNFFINPQVFFSNRNEPNLAQTLRMLRMGSVRDCLPWHQQPCHADAGLCDGGHLWLRFSCPFFLIRKDQRIKADIKGLPHQATAPPPCRPGPRTLPGRSLAFPHTTQGKKAGLMDNAPFPCRHRGPRPAISYTARGAF